MASEVTVRIEDVYRPAVDTCPPTDRLRDAARRMERCGTGVLVVMDGGTLTGVISERDVVRAVANESEPGAAAVTAYATTRVATASLGEDTAIVARRMLDLGIRRLPVVGPVGELVGIVSMRDLFAVETLA
jgi:CBS domain-containing protein